MARSRREERKDPALRAAETAWQLVRAHPLFAEFHVYSAVGEQSSAQGWAWVAPDGDVTFTPAGRTDVGHWQWVFAHCLLHLGFEHVDPPESDDMPYHVACCVVVERFLASLKLGSAPWTLPAEWPAGDEVALARRWRADGVPDELRAIGPGAGASDFDVAVGASDRMGGHWADAFAVGLSNAASAAVDVAGGVRASLTEEPPEQRAWSRALSWFVSSYPLLGALAARIEIVADADVARGSDIAVATVDATLGEIYINPLASMSEDEWRFVLAHEMLHAALRHGDRRGPRDPYLHNVAADFVVNGWLVEMRLGTMPDGALYDPELTGYSLEEVYDRIARDLRRYRKLATLRGRGGMDVLGEPLARPETRRVAVDLDEYYRRALSTGLAYHYAAGRGLLPAGLVEEIRALEQPPPPWDVKLARWFDEHLPAPEPRRTYARPSRRQSATPGIPRPGWYRPDELFRTHTFGVVLDTSLSMSRRLLAKALGAIASYATAREVSAARVVFCDAAAYDAGYLLVDEIADRVRVTGRGGTRLQPGVTLLERAADFPDQGPILIITDGACDVVTVKREHAFLVPDGATLPFGPRGPVFWLS